MKKKVALLLALVMILSALPMNVFGDDAPVRWNLTGAGVTGHFVDRGDSQDITVRLPLNHVFGGLGLIAGPAASPITGMNELRLVLDIQHANFNDFLNSIGIQASGTGAMSAADANAAFQAQNPGGRVLVHSVTPDARSTSPARTISPEAFEVRLVAITGTGDHRGAIIQINYNPALHGGMNANDVLGAIGGLDFVLRLTARDHADWQHSRISVADQTGGAGVGDYIRNWPLSNWQDGTVTIDVNGGARGFTSQLHNNPIRVRETRWEVLPGTVTLRLEAPAFYSWSFTPYDDVTIQGVQVLGGRTGAEHQMRAHGIGSISNPRVTAIRSNRAQGTAGLHVLYITLELPRNTALRPMVGGFEIRNLWLVPDYNAPASGEVHVNALLGQWQAGTPGTPGAPQVPDRWEYYRHTGLIFNIPAISTAQRDAVIRYLGQLGPDVTITQTIIWNFLRDAALRPDWFFHQVDGINAFVLNRTGDSNVLVHQPILLTQAMVNAGYAAAIAPGSQQNLWSNAGAVGTQVNNRRWSVATTQVGGSLEVWEMVVNGVTSRVEPNREGSTRVWEYVMVPGGVYVPATQAITRTDLPRQLIPGSGAVDPVDPVAAGFRYGIGRGGYRQRLHVGTRGTASLIANVYNVPYMRTGHLGLFRCTQGVQTGGHACLPAAVTFRSVENIQSGMQNLHIDYPQTRNVPWNRDNGGIPHFTGVATGSLIIEETIPGGFTSGFGSPIHFQFLDDDGNPHPGIQILGVQARAGNNYIDRHREWYNNGFRGFHAGTPGFANNYERQNWMTFAGWLGALDQRLPVVPGVGRLSAEQATIYLPTQSITDIARPGALEIRFFLSLEAGFEWKYGRNVDVTISGPGVAHLAEADRVQTIGHAVDPIVATFGSVVEVEGGTLYNVHRQALEDVVVDVINPNAFTIGSELWVYVSEDGGPAPSSSLNLAGVPTLSVANSNMRFSHGQRDGDRVVFSVVRAPDANDEPTLTISGINVSGIAYPGVEYQVVVSGTGIANNDMTVFLHTFAGQGTPGQLRSLARGVFNTLPYYDVALTNAGEGRWEGAPGYDAPPAPPEPPQPPVPPVREYRLQEGVPFGGVAEPLIWHIVGRNRVGMVSMRAFAVLIGASEDQIVWNSETRVAEVRGQHFNGETVGVAVQMGNTNATVVIGNAAPQTVDIATAV
ncbi:MAG: hypothetical protein FWC32_11310, partial [Firmicutes bacterium]|nr:hypothetical protein [Bacillota bacterium]